MTTNDTYAGKWLAFDFHCTNNNCVFGPLLYRPPARIPAFTLQFVEALKLDDGTPRCTFRLDGQFASLLVGLTWAKAPGTVEKRQKPVSAIAGRLPGWNGLECPGCNRANYQACGEAIKLRSGRMPLTVTARLDEQSNTRRIQYIRIDSLMALDLWLLFDVSEWQLEV